MTEATVNDHWVALPVSAERRPRLKTSERVAREIVGWVAEGKLRSGDRLPSEATLLDHFEVSRGSMREALRVLESAGVVALSTGRPGGSVIQDTGVSEFARTSTMYLQLLGATYRELLETRLVTEPILAARAAARREPAGIEAMGGDLEVMEAGEGIEKFVVAEMDFHVHLAVASGNRALALYIGAAAVVFGEYSRQLVDPAIVPRQSGLSVKGLRGVFDAIMGGEEAVAQRRMHRYLTAYAELFEPKYAKALDKRVVWES